MAGLYRTGKSRYDTYTCANLCTLTDPNTRTPLPHTKFAQLLTLVTAAIYRAPNYSFGHPPNRPMPLSYSLLNWITAEDVVRPDDDVPLTPVGTAKYVCTWVLHAWVCGKGPRIWSSECVCDARTRGSVSCTSVLMPALHGSHIP